MCDWKLNSAPPNEVVVEVLFCDDTIGRLKAVYGRDGCRPHWRSEDENSVYTVDVVKAWRPIDTDRPKVIKPLFPEP